MTMEIDQLGGFLVSQQAITIIGQTGTAGGPNTLLRFTQNISKYKIQTIPAVLLINDIPLQ